MERNVLALIGAAFVVAACGGPGPGSMLQSDFQNATVDEPDGRVSLYSGHLIADALARGDDLESPSFMTAFLRVRVPRSFIGMVPTTLTSLSSFRWSKRTWAPRSSCTSSIPRQLRKDRRRA